VTLAPASGCNDDGDEPSDEAMLRVLHLGLDAPAVDVYAVNEAGGDPLFLLAHLDGSTARLNGMVWRGAHRHLQQRHHPDT